MLVLVTVLVVLENGVVDAVVSSRLEKDVDDVGNDEKDRDDTRDLQRLVLNLCIRVVVAGKSTMLENGW